MMKIVFYKGYEFLELIDSYFAKFDGAPNFVVVKEEDINSVMFRFENSQIEFNNPNSNSCFIKGNNLKRILQAIIYFCENDFTPRYFFEILSLIKTDLSEKFFDFFRKNPISHDCHITKILDFTNLQILHHNLFLDVIDWYRKLKKFYQSKEKSNLYNFFSKNIILLRELFLIFQDVRCRKSYRKNFLLQKSSKVYAMNFDINLYCELIKSQNATFKSNENSKNVIISREIIDENFDLLKEENTNIFYFIELREELENFFCSKIFIERENIRANLILFVDDDLQNYVGELRMANEIKKYKFSNPFENSKSQNKKNKKNSKNQFLTEKDFKKFYQTEAEKILNSKTEIKLTASSIKRISFDKSEFFKKDILKYYDDYKATDKMIFDGYFDYLLQNVLYRFFEDKKCYLPIVLKEEIEKMYHQSYFGYIYKIMEIIISNFLVAFNEIKILANENKYSIETNQKIQYKIKVKGKLFRIECKIQIKLENSDEIILYDFFTKDLEKHEFCNFRRPSIILAGMYLKKKYQGKKISLRYWNLNEKSEEKIIKNTDEVIINLEKLIKGNLAFTTI